ncbi:MAG: ECF transporter S component [Spirochaetota bacterium]|nr:ECF transporter S component [Spirochaetota bacterium]
MTGKNSWKLNEIVVLVILSVALGVLFWAWTFVSALAAPLSALGLNYVLVGVWLMGGTLVPYLIRRPGAALLGEAIAALLEGFITKWGITALIWGIVQGLGAELIFASARYKRWDLKIMLLAGTVSGVFSYILDFVYSQYWSLQPWVWAVQLISVAVGGAFWAGFIATKIGRGIIKTGAAVNLLSGYDVADE